MNVVTFLLMILSLDACVSVDVTVTSLVVYSETNLQIECRPANGGTGLNQVDVLQFYKNSSGALGDTDSRIVSVTFSRETLNSVINWQDSDLGNRSTAIGSVNSASTSFLTLTINASDVICADEAAYRCEMIATDTNGAGIAETNDVFIGINSNPNAISLSAASSSGETTTDSTLGVFDANTTVTLTCNLTVGKPPLGVKWCVKTSNDTEFRRYSNPEDITTSNATFQENICQYRRTTTLTYVVGDDVFTTFLCEDDSNMTCGNSFVQANFTVTTENVVDQTTMNSDVTADVTHTAVTDVTQETTYDHTAEPTLAIDFSSSSDVNEGMSTFTTEFTTDITEMIQSTTDTGQDVTSDMIDDTSDVTTVTDMDSTSELLSDTTSSGTRDASPSFTGGNTDVTLDYTSDSSGDRTSHTGTTESEVVSKTTDSTSDWASSTTFVSISDDSTVSTLSASDISTVSSTYSNEAISSTTEKESSVTTGDINTTNSESTNISPSIPTSTDSNDVEYPVTTISDNVQNISTSISAITSGAATTTSIDETTQPPETSTQTVTLTSSSVPSISNETSSSSSSIPSTSSLMPSLSVSTSTPSSIAPPISSMTPLTSSMTPPTSSMTQPIISVTPSTSSMAPPSSSMAPPTASINPSTPTPTISVGTTTQGSPSSTGGSQASQRNTANLPEVHVEVMIFGFLSSLVFFAH